MSAQKPDLVSKISKRILRWTGAIVAWAKTFAAVGLLAVCFAHMSDARADSASCLAKAAAFVTELDELLEKESEDKPQLDSKPYSDLVERYFPLRDCETEALLDVVRRSRFIRSILHNPRTIRYYVDFQKDPFGVWFTYLVSEGRSIDAAGGFIRKP
jgi:hypothetical protein